MLLDSDTEDDEKISSKGETFAEEKWLQLTEQENSNTSLYSVVKVYFKENRPQFCCTDTI